MSFIYALVIRCEEMFDTEVGSIGDVQLSEGWYTYVGSSRDRSFSRLRRHRDVSQGINNTQHWHIDYLSGSDNTTICGAYVMTDVEECSVADCIDTNSIAGFGSSDCNCETHLRYDPEYAEYEKTVRNSVRQQASEYYWVDAESFENINGLFS